MTDYIAVHTKDDEEDEEEKDPWGPVLDITDDPSNDGQPH